jgi:hypothetical protein
MVTSKLKNLSMDINSCLTAPAAAGMDSTTVLQAVFRRRSMGRMGRRKPFDIDSHECDKLEEKDTPDQQSKHHWSYSLHAPFGLALVILLCLQVAMQRVSLPPPEGNVLEFRLIHFVFVRCHGGMW